MRSKRWLILRCAQRISSFSYRKSRKSVPTSTVHSILKNRLYMGEFEWNGRLYRGNHQPLVSRELWGRVQEMLNGRHASKHRRAKHDFAFSGLIACGHCGCSLVGEIKKQRYGTAERKAALAMLDRCKRPGRITFDADKAYDVTAFVEARPAR